MIAVPTATEPGAPEGKKQTRARSRLPWGELLLRVFREDVLACDRCRGRRVVLAFLTDRAVVKAILENLGLPTTGPPMAPARVSAQIEFQPWQDA